MGFYRIRDGRIAEHWVSEDSLGLAQQLARLHNGA
jgi:predicted ester cyclase